MPKCLAPWTNLDISPNGDISPCCKFQIRPHNVTRDSISDYTNSDFLDDIKKQLINDEWPDACVRCRIEEENGIESKRQLDYTRWKEQYEEYGLGQGFLTASIAFGNVCNLKCITCGSKTSTRWRKEYQEIYGIDAKPIEIFNSDFIEELMESMPNLIHLDIPGGEPLLSQVENQKELLRVYVKNGRAKDITLHYTTNAQVFPDEEWWDIWEHFKEIDMQLSIDGIGEHYEYIRYPASWDKLLENVSLYKQKQSDAFRLSISHTVSAYNIYYLDNFFDWCEEMELPKPWCGRVHTPKHMRPSVWSSAAREEIISKLSKSSDPEVGKWVSLIKDTKEESLFNDFCMYLKKHDEYRGLDFSKTFPEMARFIS